MYLKENNIKHQLSDKEKEGIIRKEKYKYKNVTLPNFDAFHIKNMIYTGLDLLSQNHIFKNDLKNKIAKQSMLNSLTEFGYKKPDSKNIKNIVMIVVDSISYKYFNKVDKELKFSDNALKFPISSTFPTITQVCLPTIWSGLTPSEHGIIGRLSYLKEVNCTTGPFVRSPFGIDDENLDEKKVNDLLSFKSIATEIMENNINLSVYISQNFPRFTSLLYPRDVNLKYYNKLNSDSFGDAYIKKIHSKDTSVVDRDLIMMKDIENEILNDQKTEPKFIFGHFLGISQAIHNFKMEKEEFHQKMLPFWKALKEFEEKLPSDTALIISSDHGAKQLVAEENVFISEELSSKINKLSYSIPAGNQRSSYFYIKEENKEQAKELLKENMTKNTQVLDMDEELYQDLFGSSLSHKTRAGELLLLNTSNGLVHFNYDLKFKSSKLSDHGGLSDEEIFVPMLIKI